MRNRSFGIVTLFLLLITLMLSVSSLTIADNDQKKEEKKESAAEKKEEEKKPASETEKGTKPKEAKETPPAEEKKKEEKQTNKKVKAPFRVGEKLTYNIEWSDIHAGVAILCVKKTTTYKGKEVYQLEHTVTAAEVIDLFYPVKNTAASYIDAQTLCPLRIEQKTRQGKTIRDEIIEFDRKEKTAKYYKRSRKEKKCTLRCQHNDLPGDVQDVLSSLYYMRRQFMEVGKTYSVDVVAGKRLTEIKLEVLEKKRLKIKGVGTFSAIKVKPQYTVTKGKKSSAASKLFISKAEPIVWFDQVSSIPIYMKVELTIGHISVTLSKIEFEKQKKKKEKK